MSHILLFQYYYILNQKYPKTNGYKSVYQVSVRKIKFKLEFDLSGLN